MCVSSDWADQLPGAISPRQASCIFILVVISKDKDIITFVNVVKMETNKPKPRPKPCRYGAECQRISTCKFTHPAQSISNSTKKEVDRSTIPCRFGLGCNRAKCPFLHPQSPPVDTSPISPENESTVVLPDSPPGSPNKAIKKKCRYGAACNRKNCKFVHPDIEPQVSKSSETYVGGMGSSAASTLNQYVAHVDGEKAGDEVEQHSILPPVQNISGSKKTSAKSNGQTSTVSQTNGVKGNPYSNGAAGKSKERRQPGHHQPEFPYVSDIEQNVHVSPHSSPKKNSRSRTPLYQSKRTTDPTIHSQLPEPPFSMGLPHPPGLDAHKLSSDDAWLYEVLKVEGEAAAANGSATKAKHSSSSPGVTKMNGKKVNGSTASVPAPAASFSDPRTTTTVVSSGINNMSKEDINEAKRAAVALGNVNNTELLSTMIQLCRSKQQMVMDGLERSMSFAGTDNQVDESVVVELLELNEMLLTSISKAESTLKIGSAKHNAKIDNGMAPGNRKGKENRATQQPQVVPKSPKRNDNLSNGKSIPKTKETKDKKVQKNPPTEAKAQNGAFSESKSSGKSKEQQKSHQVASQATKPKSPGKSAQAPTTNRAQKESNELKAPTSSKKDQIKSLPVEPMSPKRENKPSNGVSSATLNDIKPLNDQVPASSASKAGTSTAKASKSPRVENAVVSENASAKGKISNDEQAPKDQEPAYNPVDVVQQEKERLAKLLEEERQKAAAAREKKKCKKSMKFDRWVKGACAC